MKDWGFRGEGNGICKRCRYRYRVSGLCKNQYARERLILRTRELEEATATNLFEYKRLDAYWGMLAAMSELNECQDFMRSTTWSRFVSQFH